MTVHILLSLLTLVLFIAALRHIGNRGKPLVPYSLMWLIALLLPVSFAPIVPLSHFVFEMSSDNVQWFGVCFGLLWIAAWFGFWRIRAVLNLALAWILTCLLAIFAFWGVLGVYLSSYELPGATPTLSTAPIYVAHWLSV